MRIEIISFGHLHGPAPAAHLALDVRAHFHDPHRDKAVRHLTARHPTIQDKVATTPGIPQLLDATVAAAQAFAAGPAADTAPLTIAVGCAGGKHRAGYLADQLGERLTAAGHDVHVTHRDIDKAVVER
ncbi:ATPase [Kitasatospora sp. NPDC098652]|uniref:RapZ C-terminal domain-containing protein n=1 Tax=Kitasatospora sp. NPDC098652 TaxID=3364095 RepID=UPI00380BD8A8